MLVGAARAGTTAAARAPRRATDSILAENQGGWGYNENQSLLDNTIRSRSVSICRRSSGPPMVIRIESTGHGRRCLDKVRRRGHGRIQQCSGGIPGLFRREAVPRVANRAWWGILHDQHSCASARTRDVTELVHAPNRSGDLAQARGALSLLDSICTSIVSILQGSDVPSGALEPL